LLISDVRHNIEFEEYPHTSNEGIAYVYNVSGWNGETAKKTFALINVQYSLGHPSNVKKNIFCNYFACHVHREYRSCQGIKVCEFADPWLFEQHTQVNFNENVYQRVFDQHESMSDNFELRYLYRMSFVFVFIRCN